MIKRHQKIKKNKEMKTKMDLKENLIKVKIKIKIKKVKVHKKDFKKIN